jgi:hypothetical protein
MATPEIHRLFLQPLHSSGIAYMITGSVAAIAYGEPRMTNDVDLILKFAPGSASELAAAFPTADYYVPPLEVMEEERQRPQHGHFNIIHHETGLRADIYLAGDDPLHEWAFARRETAPVGGEEIWFAPVEYVVIRKLEYFEQSGSDRHLRDIAGILRISGDRIDHESLARLIAERELKELWERASSMGPQ